MSVSLGQFPERDACAPKALMQLFNESYDASCKRIVDAGGDYHGVTGEVMHSILDSHFTVTKIEEPEVEPEVRSWAEKKGGLWFIATSDVHWGGGHALLLKNGQLLGNEYLNCWIKPKLTVSVAWKLKEAA